MDNKGFSLVELLVSIAILAIVSAGVFALMSSGSNAYKSVSDRVDIEIEAQAAMSQLENHLMDASAAVTFEGGKLIIINNAPDGGYSKKVVAPEGDEGDITYYSYATADSPEGEGGIMARNVSALSVTFDISEGRALAANVTLTLTIDGRERTERSVVALRNKPIFAYTEAELITALNKAQGGGA